MRLIDADSLYDALGNKLTWLMGYGDWVYLTVGNDIKDTIEEQPTAYDVGKVVDELEKKKGTYFDGITCEGTKIKINDAIEIVKQGGVSDDVCERKYDEQFEFVKSDCGSMDTHRIDFKKLKYCPYCGKKIKAVE